MLGKGSFVIAAVWLSLSVCPTVKAEQPLSSMDTVDVAELIDQGESRQALRRLVISPIPHRYENTKDWGGTKEVWNGVRVSFDGLRPRSNSRRRVVNHGTWKRYEARLIHPDESFDVAIEKIRPSATEGVAFDVVIDADLALSGRLSEWQRDVQLFSFSAQADATVRLRVSCEAAMRLDFERLPPDVVVQPKVTAVDVQLVRFQLHRISDLGGPAVRALGRNLHDVLQDEINDRRPEMVEKANRQISKNEEALRLSLHALANDGWESARELIQGR